MRGDEPRTKKSDAELLDPFPTCVGMNRTQTRQTRLRSTVPHMRGDEP